jgi:hypothetical protein
MSYNTHYKKENVTSFEFATSQEAWVKLNEMFLCGKEEVFSTGILSSGAATSYNVFLKIRKLWIDPEFDYGRMFNYHVTKWNTLINNYIDQNAIDLLKSKVRYFVNNNRYSYSFTYHFENNHSSGKGCLIALTVSRRLTDDVPTLTLLLRSSEITKRLVFDLLLIQRIAEYIFGKDQSCILNIFASQMYGNIETLIMFDSYKPLDRVFKHCENKEWRDKIMERYTKMKTGTPDQYNKYKVFLRSFKVLRPDLYTYAPLLAKNLLLVDEDIEYPETCISMAQRRDYKKKLIKNHSI